MTTTTPPITEAAFAARKASQAERSDAIAMAYRHLARLIGTTPELAAIVEFEFHRAVRTAEECEVDADDLRGQALRAGFDPSTAR